MDWSHEMVISFINELKIRPCIWNPRDENYKNRKVVTDAWKGILRALNFKDCSLMDLKRKRDSLMASYRTLVKKKRERSDPTNGRKYEPSWFAYPAMESFLGPLYSSEHFIKTEDLTLDDPLFEDYEQSRSEAEEDIEDHAELYENYESIEDFEPQSSTTEAITTSQQRGDKRTHDNAFSDNRRANANRAEEDECDLYVKLLAKKLRKFDDLDREIVMHEIDNLVFKKLMLASGQSSKIANVSRPSSSAS